MGMKYSEFEEMMHEIEDVLSSHGQEVTHFIAGDKIELTIEPMFKHLSEEKNND